MSHNLFITVSIIVLIVGTALADEPLTITIQSSACITWAMWPVSHSTEG